MLRQVSKLTFIFLIMMLVAACGDEETSPGQSTGDSSYENPASESKTSEESSGDSSSEDSTTEEFEENPSSENSTSKESGEDPYNTEDLPNSDSVESGDAPRSALIADTNSYSTMEEYLWLVVDDVDKFWSTLFVNAGLQEPFVYASFPGPGESVPVKCGVNSSDDASALYCSEDDQIVISQVWATTVWEGTMTSNKDQQLEYPTGDFSVAFFVAHEYAHSVQTELGIGYIAPFKDEELHADCFAGVWASSVNYRQLLETGDLEEVLRTTYAAGDYQTTNVGHHGTPEERYTAFKTGYESGDPAACNNYLAEGIQ